MTPVATISPVTKQTPPIRPEYECDLGVPETIGAGQMLPLPLPLAQRWWREVLRKAWRKAWQNTWLRKTSILILLALLWEAAARWKQNDLLFPTFLQTAHAFVQGVASGELIGYAAASLIVLLEGYLIGIAAALLLSTLAISTRFGRDLLVTLTSMFNPLPAIALLPLALLWFGLGKGSLLFVLIHSVLWPLALNTFAGFQGVPETLRMAGRNYGLGRIRIVTQILIPAAMPSIVSGLKIGWAFGWRTLIAAELVFGTTSGTGGLGWYIFQNRNELYTDKVFAGLAMVIIIGLLVDNFVFTSLEKMTLRRWGMQGV